MDHRFFVFSALNFESNGIEYLESTCLSGIAQEALCFGKNLNNLLIFRLIISSTKKHFSTFLKGFQLSEIVLDPRVGLSVN